MDLHTHDYKFCLREWLQPFSNARKRLIINKIIKESGQSKFTIKRIMYMKRDNTSYVRSETKEAICRILEKDITTFENNSRANQNEKQG